MVEAISNELRDQFDVEAEALADHVMYCLPPGTMPYIGYAWTEGRNRWLSVYSDNWCTYLSSQMHEIGHSFGLSHSGEDGAEYGDQSCMVRQW